MPRISWTTALPAFGILTFCGLKIHQKYIESRLESEMVQQVLTYFRSDPEVMAIFGGDFRVRTNMLSTAKTTYNFKGPFGESKFYVRAPTGQFVITFNATSQTYQNILDSARPAVNKAKFLIPEQSVINQIKAADSQAQLEKTPLDPRKRFWSIDFISIQGKETVNIRKPSNVIDLETPRPTLTNLYEVQQSLQALKDQRKEIDFSPLWNLGFSNGLVDFRMRGQLEKRMSLIASAGYLFMMGSIIALGQRRRWDVESLANHIFMLKAKGLVAKAFPEERALLFNKTSLQGLYEGKAVFQVQFSGKKAAGTAFFNLQKGEGREWDWKEARVEYRTPEETHLEKSLMEWAKEERIHYVDRGYLSDQGDDDIEVKEQVKG